MSRPIHVMNSTWADLLGCGIEDLERPGTRIVPASDPAYHGAQLFRRGAACIVSAPPPMVSEIARLVELQEPDAVFDPTLLLELFAARVERLIGPAYLGYLEPEEFRPADTRGTRLLTGTDRPALDCLASACQRTEWEHSGIEWGAAPLFGCFVEGELAASGILSLWRPDLAHVGILTHPSYRGRGCGKAVVSAMAAYGLAHGRTLQYRTLLANEPSVCIARSLGFHDYASTLAVRFR